jgi:hypothetical protein
LKLYIFTGNSEKCNPVKLNYHIPVNPGWTALSVCMKDLTPVQQHVLLLCLRDLARANHGRLPYGAFKAVATRLGYQRRTPSRLWHAHKDAIDDPALLSRLGAKRKGRCGHKPIAIDAIIAAVPAVDRLTVRAAAAKTGLSRTTVWRKIKMGLLVTRCARLKLVDLLRVVQHSFANLPKKNLENVFYTLFRCMEASMLIGGYTTYKMPRSHKARLRKTPGAMDTLEHCSLEAWLTATEALKALNATGTV